MRYIRKAKRTLYRYLKNLSKQQANALCYGSMTKTIFLTKKIYNPKEYIINYYQRQSLKVLNFNN